jgi:selenium donor protein
MNRPIYLDYNASTPLLPEVIQAIQPYLTSGFGNPSSTHYFGRESRRAIENARQQVAALINADPEEIIFTSGGTESNNLAIRGIAALHPGGHIITSTIEHPAVLEVCRFLEKQGYEISYIGVDATGRVDPQQVAAAIQSNTCLISIMLANNEVGTLQPIRAIVALAHRYNIPVHTDAAQALGKVAVDVQTLGVDLLSIAGHKMYAPKGIGALFIRHGLPIAPLIFGAGHEHGLRPGTENVLEIVGLGAAADYLNKNFHLVKSHIEQLGELFYSKIRAALPSVELNGSPNERLPNTFNLYFPGVDANALLAAMPEIAASTGAACHADSVNPSHVLQAMGFSNERAQGSIRFSLGYLNSLAEIERAAQIITHTAQSLQVETGYLEPAPDVATVRLTQFTHGLGCACKIRPQTLQRLLQSLPPQIADAVQVGFETSDDAAVYRLTPDLSLVTTVDFFTPIVDDPYQFGRIAATNALSDIYAMGAKPLLALNIVAFPEKRLPLVVLEKILQGAQETAQRAGIPILGGHTIEDNEPKFGWVVVGTVAPDKIWRNVGAQPGDQLILTKPLGIGILTTALKRGLLDAQSTMAITDLMAQLNAKAADILQKYPVHACTDVTGYGLLGHLHEMLNDKLGAYLHLAQIPVIDGVRQFILQDVIPGGTLANLEYVSSFVDWSPAIHRRDQILLCDAQSSGGLLAALPAQYANAVLADMLEAHLNAALIGEFIQQATPQIKVVP